MVDVLAIERKTGDTYPILASIVDADGVAYPLTNVTQIVLVVSDQKDEVEAEAVELFSVGSVVDEALGTATFPCTVAIAALVKSKYYAEIRMVQSTYVRTTNTFEYKVVVRVGSVTGV